MEYDLFLKNALIVTEQNTFLGGVVIGDGKIQQLVDENHTVDAVQSVDLGGKALFPGLVDDHVHFNEPGRTHWEGYLTGSQAAVAGGVTTVLEMPLNANPPTTNRARLAEKRALAATQSVVDYAHWGGLVDNNLHDLDGMHTDGVIGFKAFMSNSGVEFSRIDDDILYAGLLHTTKTGSVIGLHAENEYITHYLGEKYREAGRIDRRAWGESRPVFNEVEAISRACYLAKVTGGNLHIVHISTAEGLREIARAKEDGVRVTAETCPHYLFFDEEDFIRIGPLAKCSPPIRDRANREELWQCLRDGLVDTVASDHSPCTWPEKEAGLENIWKAWGGITGIQTMLPALITAGYHQRKISLSQLAKVTSANTARIFGIYPRKGAVLPGSDADFTVVDLDKEWTLSTEQLFSKNKCSPYVGLSFKGKVEQTYLRGKLVYQDGNITVKPGYGQLILKDQ
jgi:allantoinase